MDRRNNKIWSWRQLLYDPYCSYPASVILFYYGIEEYHRISHDIPDMYYLIKERDNEIPFRTIDPIDARGNRKLEEYILCPSIYEAKYFLRHKLDIDIIEYPQINKQEKTYCADIYIEGKPLKHKKYADKTYDTPEEAFENALMYVLIKYKSSDLGHVKIYRNSLYILNNLDNLDRLNIVKIRSRDLIDTI